MKRKLLSCVVVFESKTLLDLYSFSTVPWLSHLFWSFVLTISNSLTITVLELMFIVFDSVIQEKRSVKKMKCLETDKLTDR